MLLKFTYRLLLFSLPVLVTFGYLEFKLRNANNYYGEKYEGFTNNIEDIEYLFLGTSHTDNAINPEKFDHLAYNLAIGSQSIYYDTEIVNNHLERLKSLKVVFFSIDYHNLYFDHVPARDFAYKHYYNILPPIKKTSGSRFNLMAFEYGFEKSMIELKRPSYGLKLGYDLNQSHDNKAFTNKWINERVAHFDETINNGMVDMHFLVSCLNHTIITLKSNGITPVILTPPCHESIVQKLSKEQININNAIISELCAKHNIEHWDYLNYNLEKSYFVNPDHLNYKGACAFSDVLNERLNSSRF